MVKMQGFIRAVRSCHETLKLAILQHSLVRDTTEMNKIFSRCGCVTSSPPAAMHQKGLENTTVADVLMTKGGEKVESWLWCSTDDTVHDAVKQMAQNNVGSLVVLKPVEQQMIAGIITERDYLRKVIAKDRPPKYTKVREIMTDQHKLITVTSNTNILHAMQLMTENHIRHVPEIDENIVGMISVVDVVRAVVEQQSGEVKRLNEFIKGGYSKNL
ncbi:CBS domain-containing protein CBSX3, mitochondrial-like isoform X1 [Camellia sinensis]|uniref:CBS domain-containing protein CBSX3, mitochondrial-like isoform X1 n=2 Tax=Camellia sinensis TaxID=4442 RepID=UPI001035C1AB|nr:CBS domain-containing protein CBSX3, mitochondrial-like isoform X1 [Camellia sinensis]